MIRGHLPRSGRNHRPIPFALLLLTLPVAAGAVPPGFTVTPVHTSLGFPLSFRFLPDGRLLYAERGGRIMVFDSDDDHVPRIWANLAVSTSGYRGLLGMAIHPDWPDSPFVYFYHSHPNPLVNRVVRFRDQGGFGVSLAVLRNDIPAAGEEGHGGRLAFAPDGHLWLAYGDQNSPSAAQDPADVRGKLLRLTSMAENAPGNPYGGGAGVALGVRNPFGLCFDPITGRGYFTENGASCNDELNVIVEGANYGWGLGPICGSQPPPGTQPALALFNSTIVPTGCVVARGSSHPALEGNLFFGSYRDNSLRRVYFTPGSDGSAVDSVVVFHQVPGGSVLDVTMGIEGKLWFSTPDAIYRIDPPAPVAVVTPEHALHRLLASPNPFTHSVRLALEGAGASAQIEIHDSAGRLIRRWTGAAPLRWDGRDESGRAVPPGVYVVRARGEDWEATARLARIGVP